MAKIKENRSRIERVTLKLSKSVAEYFRQAFPHGKRSGFVADCLKRHRREQEIKAIEEELRSIGRERQ